MATVSMLVGGFAQQIIVWAGIITVAQAAQVVDGSTGHGCVLSGLVTHRGTPIKSAAVFIRPAQPPEELGVTGEMRRLGIALLETSTPQSIKSDDAGRFCFNAIAPGRYTVSAKKSGYLETPYGAISAFESGAILSIKQGERYPPIELKLIAQAVLTGRVCDPDGDPVDQGSVVVVSNVALKGTYRTVAIRTVLVNDLGEFRISQLPPGQYYVRFQPPIRPLRRPNSASGQGASPRMPRLIATLFPSATTIAEAAPVMLQAGDTSSNIVITAQRQQTYAIRGRLAGLAGFAAGAVMNLSPADEEQTVIVAGGGNLDQDNTFEFEDVSAGNYTITYLDQTPSYVQMSVRVTGSDVDNLILRPPSTAQIKGRISMVTSMPGDLARVRVGLRAAADRVVSPVFMANVGDNGSLTFDKPIPSGVYRTRIDVPEGYYVKSIQYAGADVTGGVIDIGETGGDLGVVISSGTGQLEVRVEQENPAVAGSLHYVIVRSETDGGGQGVYMAVTRDDGTVGLKNLPPGRYRAYAFRSADITAVKAAEPLRILEQFATSVEVSGNTSASATVRVVPAERAGVAFQGSTNW